MSVTVPGSVVLVVVEVELLLDVEVLVLDVLVEVVLLVVLLVDEVLLELLDVVLLVDDDVVLVLLEVVLLVDDDVLVVLEVDVVDVAPGSEVLVVVLLVVELLDVVVVVELVVLLEDVDVDDDEVVEDELVDVVVVVDDDVVDVLVPDGGSRLPATDGGDCPGNVPPLLKKIVLNAPARHPGCVFAAISARLVAPPGSPSTSWSSTLANACTFVSPASRRSRIAQP